MIEKTLSLTTRHAPNSDPSFNEPTGKRYGPRVCKHEYGWLVFVDSVADCAEWLQPIMEMAINKGCTLICFDNVCLSIPGLKLYNW